MKIFFDTEFLDHGSSVELVSLGAVREDGSEFYMENAEANLLLANSWVQKNVIPKFTGPAHSLSYIADHFKQFCGNNPQFWAYYCAWDWMLVCQLMGGFMKLPSWWPGYCNDINTILVLRNQHPLAWNRPEQKKEDEHHALYDARWVRDAYNSLRSA